MSELIALGQVAATINQLNGELEMHKGMALVTAALIGDQLKKVKGQTDVPFVEWLEGNCTVKKSQAYNYMRLAEEYPELLQPEFHLNGKKLPELTQAINLLSAPDEVKAEVMERIEDGEQVTNAEIVELKKQAKELEERNKKLANANQYVKDENDAYKETLKNYQDENDALKRSVERAQALEQQKIDEAVNAQVESSKVEMQAELDRIAGDLAREYEAKINAQTDKISELRAKLANPEASGDGQKLEDLEQQVADAELQLLEIQQKRDGADHESVLCGALKQILRGSAEVRAQLLDKPGGHRYSAETLRFIEQAAHELSFLETELSEVQDGE